MAVDTRASSSWRASENVVFTNGLWFDGKDFQLREAVYVVDGRIADSPSPAANTSIDLTSQYVIPPLADGHTHSFDGPFGLAAQQAKFLDDGVFYAATMTAPSRGVQRIRPQLSGPKNVDVASAMGGITGPDSHPAEIYEANALGFFSPAQQIENATRIRQSRRMADNAYFVVENRAQVDNKLAMLEAFGADFVKVYLRNSERYGERKQDSWALGGIDPTLLPYIVESARSAGLRTAVAVSNVYDFRQAVRAGASVITHPPCYQSTSDPGPYFKVQTTAQCRLREDDANAAAAIGLWTIAIASEWAKDRPADLVKWEETNLGLLRRAAAPIALGSNQYGSTQVEGMIQGARKGLYPPALILRWATQDTARMIFPGRHIGCLDDGCEASFLVLAASPLADMDALRSIVLRVKDGVPLLPEDYRPDQ
jgi:imidazolonepropionase-like amidohydrolase